MRTLIVEDDFTGRLFLQEILSQYGPVHIATNGEEAVVAFKEAIAKQEPYDLVCLDIMLPGIDGKEVLREIRSMENDAENNEPSKVIMTTSVGKSSSVIESFREQCDAYVIKPFKGAKVVEQLEQLELV